MDRGAERGDEFGGAAGGVAGRIEQQLPARCVIGEPRRRGGEGAGAEVADQAGGQRLRRRGRVGLPEREAGVAEDDLVRCGEVGPILTLHLN